MFSKFISGAASVLVLGVAGIASAESTRQAQVVYTGGHEPARIVQVVPVTAQPYALTGNETARVTPRYDQARTGTRTSGPGLTGR